MSSAEIIQILQNNTDVGLTLLGGEPLDQAPAVLELIENCHTSGFDVMLYTGYELEELSKVHALVKVSHLFSVTIERQRWTAVSIE